MGICTSNKPKPRQQQKLEVRIQTITNTQADRQQSQASFYRSIDRGYYTSFFINLIILFIIYYKLHKNMMPFETTFNKTNQ